MKGCDTTRQRAVFQPFILIMQITALLLIAVAQQSNSGGTGFGLTNLLFVPPSPRGTWLGPGLFARLSDNRFTRVVNIMLIVSGASFVD